MTDQSPRHGMVQSSVTPTPSGGVMVPDPTASPITHDAELAYDGKVVGRVTSAVRDGNAVVALGYVRVEVPRDVALRLRERVVTQLDGVVTHAGNSRGNPRRREDP